MDFLFRFNNYTDEREKILKIVQYSVNVLWAYQDSDSYKNPDAIRKLKEIESHLTLVRGGLRLGKFIDYFISTFHTINLPDPILQLTMSLSQISFGTYLFYDNLLWLNRIGFIRIDQKKNRQLANSYYLYSTILALIKSIYLLKMIQNNRMESNTGTTTITAVSSVNRKKQQSTENRIIYLEILKNLCDILISINSLEKIRIDSFPVAILGLLSSTTFLLKKILT